MKKFRFFLMTSVALMVAFSGCKKNEIEGPDNPENYVGTFKLTEIVDAAAGAYAAWEETESFAATIKVGSKDLSTPEYQYAICKALVNLSAGKKDDIDVLTFKAADHPDRDSYDKETIAVTNGPKVGEDTEDLVNVATRMLARMESDLRVPNQTNFTRGDNAVAFSTERATTVISRELANYKTNGKLDAEVDAGFKGAGSSIQAFAKEYVKIIDIWQKNVGTLDRLSNWELAEDGDADIVENAHYVPNNTEIRIGETVLNTADMLEVAVRSYLLLRGYDGNAVDAVGFGSFAAATPANMNTPMPATHQYGWNKPLIETSNGGYLYKVIDEIDTYGQVDVVILDNWAQRSLNFSFTNDMMWTNFCTYPRADHNITNYKGCFSSGRALLTYAFFFKYLLDNNITKDIDKIGADVVIRSELFGIDTANNDKDIQLKDTELEFPCTEETKEAMFAAKAAWTATPSADWITVEPASGEAGAITIKVKAAENKGDAREGTVVVKGGNVTDGVAITVKQAEYTAPNTATIKEFAQEYVKILDTWQNTTGTIDMLKGEDYEGGNNKVENAHYVPSTTTITVGTKTYNTADMLELALRSYLFIRGYDGADTKNYGAGKIAALDGGAKAMSETVVPDTHEYKWGANPYNETGTYDVATGATTSNGGHFIKIVDGAAVHCQTDPTLLDNWAMRALNYSSGNPISNMCTYPRDPFNNYAGSFSSMRALITYAFFFKYMLDNNLDKADGLDATVNIRTELFGDEGYVEPAKVTIKDFATEFVKILDVWQNNTATVKMHPDAAESVENAHIIPEGTTIKVGEKTYNTADMFETAARSYLLVRGYNGLDTESYGAGKIAALDGGAKAMSETEVPPTHSYTWGSAPCNELGSYDISTGTGSGNNGHLIKIVDGAAVHCKVDVTILDNQVMRALNYSHGQDISNMCTYPRDPITNYAGSFSSMRALITYAFFFKYMLDNNLEKADGITADVAIRSELFGDEGEPEPQPVITIADFANEYVKILDVWAANVGEKKMHSSVAATPNAHFIPDDYTITVKDATGKLEKTYNTADMFETALRSYLLIRGYNGLDTESYGAGKIAALDGGALSMSETPVPETHGYTWGEAPCNETSGNGGNFARIGANNLKEFGWAKVDVLDNWAMRSLNYSHGKPITNMCTYPRADQGITTYHGSFSSMRALITFAYFFKYMIGKNYDKGTEVTADETFRTDLFGVDGQQLARWEFSATAAGKEGAYGYTFGGTPTITNGVFAGNAYVYNANPGDGGHYVDANWNGNGRITFVQIDKTGMTNGAKNAGHNVGSTGHVCCKGNWTGDYWLFKATSASELAAGTKIHVKYIFRSSASGPGYFLVQYKDGEEWKNCSLVEEWGILKKADSNGTPGQVLEENCQFTFASAQTKTVGSEELTFNARTRADGSSNTNVDTVFELTVPTTTVEIRALVSGVARPDGGTAPTSINTGTTRLAGSTVNVNGAFTSPIIEVAQFAK